MTTAFEKLVAQLSLKPVSTDIYLGESTDILNSGRIFGGQVLGQALMASSLTVDPSREVHSLHSYFIRPGDVDIPIRFEVERVRDGGTFSNRRVVAYQNDKHIFTMATSHQVPEKGFEHQDAMPEGLLGPDSFPSEAELAQKYQDILPKSIVKRHIIDGDAIEIRAAYPDRLIKAGEYPAQNYCWFKANGEIPLDNTLLHKAALAYVSDFYLIFTSLLPHKQSAFDPKLQMASLDHSLWFHRPINLNEWNVYVLESPNAYGGRGLCFGKVYNQRGELLASTAQEGLIRNTSRFAGK
ncbi:acyl-CoA thioesterase [Pelistega europaea]|uniref:Acyl-CoA thioesterase 2 n=1 Tax=Pelistega europaea TaxID=106147 RepID=A0A7Y4L879_9BURK|nr:acyl-CoA thioesterase II [Pelistega europaea]NOL48698.1 acyl-CoA thioesterase II [Pelistega europaea]